MTIEEIQKRIDEIKASADDNDRPHILEDKLKIDFITYLATECYGHLAEKAKLVLTTSEIHFSRWYA